MYDRKIKLVCAIHDLDFEYPYDWDKLFMDKPRCPVCRLEEAEKWKGRFEEMKSQRDKLLEAIEIKVNFEVENNG